MEEPGRLPRTPRARPMGDLRSGNSGTDRDSPPSHASHERGREKGRESRETGGQPAETTANERWDSVGASVYDVRDDEALSHSG